MWRAASLVVLLVTRLVTAQEVWMPNGVHVFPDGVQGPVYGPPAGGTAATQTVTAGGTITADACGGVKRLTAASAVTTNLLTTITTASAANAGCRMTVCNLGVTHPITLDANDTYITRDGLNTVLRPLGSSGSSCVDVVSTGDISWLEADHDLPTVYDVRAFGARCDGVVDDSVAIQAAVTAACTTGGTVLVPNGTGAGNSPCLIRDTITVAPVPSASWCTFSLRGVPNYNTQESLRWTGGDNKAVFRLYNVKQSSVDNISLGIYPNGADQPDGVVGFEIRNPAAAQSSSTIIFRNINCGINSTTTSGNYNTCFRGGGAANGNQDVPDIVFDNVLISSTSRTAHSIGYVMASPNVLNWKWHSGGGNNLHTYFTNDGKYGCTTGDCAGSCVMGSCDSTCTCANPPSIGADAYFFGVGGSAFTNVFAYRNGISTLLIQGGRFEGQMERFLANAIGGAGPDNITITGIHIAAANSTDGGLFEARGCDNLTLDNLFVGQQAVRAVDCVGAGNPAGCCTGAGVGATCNATGGLFGAAMINTVCQSNTASSLQVRGGAYEATDPFFTPAENTVVDLLGVIKHDFSGGVAGRIPNRHAHFTNTTTPFSETIVATGIITADQCDAIKRITAAGVVTTNTTNTFTTPSNANAGCTMDVCNVGTNAITLDANANFKTAGTACGTPGGDIVLGGENCVRVASDGLAWRQLGCTSVNN